MPILSQGGEICHSLHKSSVGLGGGVGDTVNARALITHTGGVAASSSPKTSREKLRAHMVGKPGVSAGSIRTCPRIVKFFVWIVIGLCRLTSQWHTRSETVDGLRTELACSLGHANLERR